MGERKKSRRRRWNIVWHFLKKLKIDLPHYPAITLLGIYSQGMKTGCKRDICTPMLSETLFTIAKIWKTCNGWIKM